MCLACVILRAATNKYGGAHHQYPLPISKNLWKCRIRIEMLSKVRAAQKGPMINENQKPALSISLQVFHHFEQAKTQVENRDR